MEARPSLKRKISFSDVEADHKRHKSEKPTLEESTLEKPTLEKPTLEESTLSAQQETKLWHTIATLLKIDPPAAQIHLLPFSVVSRLNRRWILEDREKNLFDLWWHEEQAEKREGKREAAIHKAIRELKVPNLLAAELDFELHDRVYLLRRMSHGEVSLADYLSDDDSPALTRHDVERGVEELQEMWHRTKNFLPWLPKPAGTLSLFTRFTSDNMMIVPNKEGGIRFMYRITSDVGVIFSIDGACTVSYLRPNDDKDAHYPVCTNLAKVASIAGAPLSYCEPLLRCHFPQRPDPSIVDYRGRCGEGISKITEEEREELLRLVAHLLIKHKTLDEQPQFVIDSQTHSSMGIHDQYNNYFEVQCAGENADGPREMMIGQIMRKHNIPRLLTAEFSFVFKNSHFIVKRRPAGYIRLDDDDRCQLVSLQMKDVLKGIEQLYEFIKLVCLVSEKDLSPSHPISFRRYIFSSNIWLVPDGSGSFDFYFEIDDLCALTTRTDDGLGIVKCEHKPFEPQLVGLFNSLGDAAEQNGLDEDVAILISELCPEDPQQFMRDLNEIKRRCVSAQIDDVVNH